MDSYDKYHTDDLKSRQFFFFLRSDKDKHALTEDQTLDNWNESKPHKSGKCKLH